MYMIEYSKEDIPLRERFRASTKLSGEYIIEPLRRERFTFRFVWSGSHDTRLLRQRFVLSDVILWMELTDICLSRWELLLQITVKWTRGTVLSHVFVMDWKFYSVCWREAHRTGLSYKNCFKWMSGILCGYQAGITGHLYCRVSNDRPRCNRRCFSAFCRNGWKWSLFNVKIEFAFPQ